MGRRGEEEDPSPLVSIESLDGVGFMHVAITAVVSSIAVAVAGGCRRLVFVERGFVKAVPAKNVRAREEAVYIELLNTVVGYEGPERPADGSDSEAI